MKGRRSTNQSLQSSPGDAGHSTGTTVRSIVMVACSARWVLVGGSLCKLYKCPAVRCTPETSKISLMTVAESRFILGVFCSNNLSGKS